MKKSLFSICLFSFLTISCSGYRYNLFQEFNDFYGTEKAFNIADTIDFKISDYHHFSNTCLYRDVINTIEDNFNSIRYEKVSPEDIPSSFLKSQETHILTSIDNKRNYWSIRFDSTDIYASFNKVKSEKYSEISGLLIIDYYSDVYHATADSAKGEQIYNTILKTFSTNQI